MKFVLDVKESKVAMLMGAKYLYPVKMAVHNLMQM